MHQRTQSQKIYESLCEVTPGGVNSPTRAFKGLGIHPMIVDHGYQDIIVDVDGNSFIDYCCSWGALIHGHAHPQILKAANDRMCKGTSFGIMTVEEEKLARKIVSHVPSVEKIRFVSSGTEATMSAIRLARGYTGRDWIVKFTGNYHGHADFLLVQAGSSVVGINPTSSSAGIPADMVKYTICLPYNDIETCRQLLNHPEYSHKIAAVILEPIAANMGLVPGNLSFIKMLREETKKVGAVLIFDEVISGYRFGLQGAQGILGIEPDLTCFGKIIGGGFPAAGFGGRTDIMHHLAPQGTVYQAGTLSGHPVAMAAGLEAIAMLEKPGFYEGLEHKAKLITEPVQELFQKKKLPMCLHQVGSLFTIFFGCREVISMEQAHGLDLNQFAEFFRYMYERGVYVPPSQYEAWFVSNAHEEKNLIKTRDLILEYFK